MSKQGEIQVQKNDIVEVEISYHPLDDEMDNATAKQHHQDINSLLGKMSNLFEIGRNAKKGN